MSISRSASAPVQSRSRPPLAALGAKGGASDERRNAPAGGAGAAAADAVSGGLKQALSGLDDLWDESQYKEEFALDGFIESLNK